LGRSVRRGGHLVRPSGFFVCLRMMILGVGAVSGSGRCAQILKLWENIGTNMARTACESAGIDPTSYLNFFDRHFGLGNTVRELSGIWLQYSPILRRSAISHRRNPLWRMVSCRLKCRNVRCPRGAPFRAGLASVYNPQCFNSGPTGRCVCTLINGIVHY
jgi:hypothetical protein